MPRPWSKVRPFLAVFVSGAVLSCGGSDSPTGNNNNNGDAIASVTVGPSTQEVDIGATVTYSATVLNGRGENVTATSGITWSVTPAGIASVSGSGPTATVTGVAEGSATVRASAGGKSGTAAVEVIDPNPPAAPSAVVAVAASNTEIDVAWTDNSDNEDRFVIEREAVGAGAPAEQGGPARAFTEAGTTGSNQTSFRDQGLDPKTKYRYLVRACNDNGCTPESGSEDEDDATSGEEETHETLEFDPAPLPDAVVSQAYGAELEASGGDLTYAFSISAGTLPPGVEMSSGGVFSGTPTEIGTFSFTVEVASGEQTASADLSIDVGEEQLPPEITTDELPNGIVGQAYAAQLEATKGDGESYVFAVIDGGLPDGLTMSDAGAIGGTPTASGSSTFTVEVTSAEMTGTAELTLDVFDPLAVATTSLPDGVEGQAYSEALASTGGAAPTEWTLAEGALPGGLELSTEGTISGTPAAPPSGSGPAPVVGTSTFTVQATSADGQIASMELSISIWALLDLTTESLPDGEVGTAYAATAEAVGGNTPYAWDDDDTLPPGLSIDAASGAISGTPTTPGSYDVVITVTSADGQTDTGEFTVTITGPPVIGTTSLDDGTVGVEYSETLAASGGNGAYAWAVIVGALPDGLTLNASTGVISGTPTTDGTFEFTVEVTSDGQTDTQELSITIAAGGGALTITTESLDPGRAGVVYDATLAASGGTPPYTWTLQSGTLPGTVGLTAGTGALGGTPAAEGSNALTFRVTDDDGATADKSLTLDVCGPAVSLGLGESTTVLLPEACGVVLPDADADYRVAFIARDDLNFADPVTGGFGLTATAGTPGVEFPVAERLSKTSVHDHSAIDPGLPPDVVDLMNRTADVHRTLRDEEYRRGAPTLPPSRIGPPRSPAAAGPERAGEANRSFFVLDPSSGSRVAITATLMGENTAAYYYVDDAVVGTGDEPTQTQVDELIDYYETHGVPIINSAFGGLGPSGTTTLFKDDEGATLTLPIADLDENGGRIIVLQVRPSLMLGGAAAYVSSCDRYPRSSAHTTVPGYYCTDSNQAEITYFSEPTSDFYSGTLVHEVKHISSHGWAIYDGRGFNPSWIEEGTAEIAKEKSSRDAAGLADGVEAGVFDVYPGGMLTQATYGMGVVMSRSRAFLAASPLSSLFDNPSPNPNSSTYYGASWLFHRFLADNYGGGDEDALFMDLNTGGSGVGQIEATLGKDLADLIAEFTTAISVDGLAAESSAMFGFPSYDHAGLATAFGDEWPYVQSSSGFLDSMTTFSTHFGAPNFFDFTTSGGTSLRLDGTDASGESLSAGDDPVLVITRIR